MSDSFQQEKPVEVAAAVLQRSDGSFLLAKRPVGKIWAGYWEFPGGKVESGETPYHALVRELREELGITVETAYPWVRRVFTYPHATVRLSFFRVTKWRGDLHPHEGQELAWQFPTPAFPPKEQKMVSPILPANAPIMVALQLPPVYAISNAQELGEAEFMRRLEAALHNGLRLVQLREKKYSRETRHALALKILPLMRQNDAKLIINADIALVQEIGADGVQLTGSQLALLDERPNVQWCAASCHNAEELRRAEDMGCDFAVLSSVLPTLSHPGEPTLGWKSFSELTRGCSIPVYALGGLHLADLETAWQRGAHGVALLRQAWPEKPPA